MPFLVFQLVLTFFLDLIQVLDREVSELRRSQYAQSSMPHYRPFGHRFRTADARFSAIGAANPHFYADSACIVQSSTEF